MPSPSLNFLRWSISMKSVDEAPRAACALSLSRRNLVRSARVTRWKQLQCRQVRHFISNADRAASLAYQVSPCRLAVLPQASRSDWLSTVLGDIRLLSVAMAVKKLLGGLPAPNVRTAVSGLSAGRGDASLPPFCKPGPPLMSVEDIPACNVSGSRRRRDALTQALRTRQRRLVDDAAP